MRLTDEELAKVILRAQEISEHVPIYTINTDEYQVAAHIRSRYAAAILPYLIAQAEYDLIVNYKPED